MLAVNPNFFGEGRYINYDDKDTIRRVSSTWICELGEVESSLKRNLEKFKAFITDSTDKYRLQYARKDVHHARRASLCATCNSQRYLTDVTGNRRFWTVPVFEIDLEELRKFNFLQLWLQIDEETKHNRQGFRLTNHEQEMLDERNGIHEKSLNSEEEIRDIFDLFERASSQFDYKEVTVSEFKAAYGSLAPYSVQQIGQALNKIGHIAEPLRKVQGKPKRLRKLPIPKRDMESVLEWIKKGDL